MILGNAWDGVNKISYRVHQQVEKLKEGLIRNQSERISNSNIKKIGEVLFRMREQDLGVLKSNKEILNLLDLLKKDSGMHIRIDQNNNYLLMYYSKFCRWFYQL
ncbi:MAG: hypothetical protein AAB035_02350 [Nitrospirota bacterium]